jgi:hypothetical protein
MELKVETLQTAEEYIVKLKQGIEKAIDKCRDNEIEKNNELLIQIIDGIRWTIDVMTLTQDIHVGELDEDKIKEKLPDMLEAFENNDKGFLADLFEYEILEGLKEYEKIIQRTLKSN